MGPEQAHTAGGGVGMFPPEGSCSSLAQTFMICYSIPPTRTVKIDSNCGREQTGALERLGAYKDVVRKKGSYGFDPTAPVADPCCFLLREHCWNFFSAMW